MLEILSAEQLAQYLGVNYRTILRLARQSRIPGRKVGNTWRFHKQAIDAWLAAPENPRAAAGQQQLITR